MTTFAATPRPTRVARPLGAVTPSAPEATPWTNAICEGHVRHHRHTPVDHHFETPTSMVLLDLDDLPHVVDAQPLWSSRRPALVRFRREDYFDGTSRSLRGAVAGLVEARTGHRPSGPILMLTQLRRLGWLFNPLTVYWCLTPPSTRRHLTRDGGPVAEPGGAGTVAAVVLEVTNTPWGERHHYVVETRGRQEGLRFPKALHVSPFLDEDLTYTLGFSTPDDGLVVRLGVDRDDERVLDTELALRRRPLTPAAVLADLARHPMATARVSATIHTQALRLAGQGRAARRPSHRGAAAVVSAGRPPGRRHAAPAHRPPGRARRPGRRGAATRRPMHQRRSRRGPVILVRDRRAYRAVARRASIGLGESYPRGWWDTDDLAALLGRLHDGVRRFDR